VATVTQKTLGVLSANGLTRPQPTRKRSFQIPSSRVPITLSAAVSSDLGDRETPAIELLIAVDTDRVVRDSLILTRDEPLVTENGLPPDLPPGTYHSFGRMDVGWGGRSSDHTFRLTVTIPDS